MIFIILLIFFDRNNLITQVKLTKMLIKLRTQKEFYQIETQKNKELIKELKTNPETLEKYAREKYLMKKDSEDIYLIIDTSSQNKQK